MADNLSDRLARALNPLDPTNNPDGPHSMSVDTRGLFTATQWAINAQASGVTAIIGNPGAGKRVWLHSIVLTAAGSLTLQLQSPSGTGLSGSMFLNPGGVFQIQGAMPNAPIFIGANTSNVTISTIGSGAIGGTAHGWTA